MCRANWPLYKVLWTLSPWDCIVAATSGVCRHVKGQPHNGQFAPTTPSDSTQLNCEVETRRRHGCESALTLTTTVQCLAV